MEAINLRKNISSQKRQNDPSHKDLYAESTLMNEIVEKLSNVLKTYFELLSLLTQNCVCS